MKYPNISIVILNWNGINDTIECLESLRNIDYDNYNVIVVDNGSKENEAEILNNKYGDRIKIIKNDKNYGFAEGNNVAIRSILTDNDIKYILLLNNDTVVEKYFLKELIKISEINENIAIVGPTVYYYDQKNLVQSAGGTINMWTGRRKVIGYKKLEDELNLKIQEVDYVTGAALLIKTSVVKKIGTLDPEYFTYTEDIDWCYRAKKAGYKIYHVPSSKIYHKESASTGGHMNPRVLFYIYRNSLIFMKKNACYYHWLTFLPVSCYYVIKRIITSDPKKIYAMSRGIFYGIFNKKIKI